MSSIEKLVSIGSEALGPDLEAMPELLERWRLGPKLFELLKLRNGFYAFESESKYHLRCWNAI